MSMYAKGLLFHCYIGLIYAADAARTPRVVLQPLDDALPRCAYEERDWTAARGAKDPKPLHTIGKGSAHASEPQRRS